MFLCQFEGNLLEKTTIFRRSREIFGSKRVVAFLANGRSKAFPANGIYDGSNTRSQLWGFARKAVSSVTLHIDKIWEIKLV